MFDQGKRCLVSLLDTNAHYIDQIELQPLPKGVAAIWQPTSHPNASPPRLFPVDYSFLFTISQQTHLINSSMDNFVVCLFLNQYFGLSFKSELAKLRISNTWKGNLSRTRNPSLAKWQYSSIDPLEQASVSPEHICSVHWTCTHSHLSVRVRVLIIQALTWRSCLAAWKHTTLYCTGKAYLFHLGSSFIGADGNQWIDKLPGSFNATQGISTIH